jgi:hypothetical protein
MYKPSADEKTTLVMAYTTNGFLRGEVITKATMRVSTWLRTDAAPEYMHLLNAQVISLSGTPKMVAVPELYFSTPLVIGFHPVNVGENALDYDPNEVNRVMLPVTVLMSTFIIKAKVRVSTQTDFGTSLTTARTAWMSLYEAEINNPFLTQLGTVKVPMLLVRPTMVSFAMEAQQPPAQAAASSAG